MSKRKISLYTLVGLGAASALAVVVTLAFAAGLALSPHLHMVAQAADGEAVTVPSSTGLVQPALEAEDVLASLEQALIDVYQTTLPSVVDIEVTQRVSLGTGNGAGGQSRDLFRQGEGSGFVWDEAGHIVTNFHVVEDSETVNVVFADGDSALAEVIGTEPDADLAVLKVDLPASELQPLLINHCHWQSLRTGLHYDQRYRQCRGAYHSQQQQHLLDTGSDPDRRRHQPRQLWWAVTQSPR
jgi:S1-C subfamily serine protease